MNQSMYDDYDDPQYDPFYIAPRLTTFSLYLGYRELKVSGGPYRNCPNTMKGICLLETPVNTDTMAVWSPIADFSTPSRPMQHDVLTALLISITTGNVYVGCMGGRGRTGLFMALMTKTAMAYTSKQPESPLEYRETPDPVDYVRKHYLSEAVETREQAMFVDAFNPRGLLPALHEVLSALDATYHLTNQTKSARIRAWFKKLF